MDDNTKNEKGPDAETFNHFDDIFEKRYGHTGKYQIFAFLLLAVRSLVIAGQFFGPIFIIPFIKHRCQIPGLTNDSFKSSSPLHSQLMNQTIPCDKAGDDGACKTWSSCEVYVDGNRSATEACSAWVYDHSTFHSTITEDFNLVCEMKTMVSHLKMILMLGILFGASIMGTISDLFGRKKVELVGYSLVYICGTVEIFSPNVWVLMVLRFLVGVGISGFQIPSFVHCMEMIGYKWRSIFGNFFGIYYSVGGLFLSMVAYFVRDWKYLQLAATLPWLPLFIIHIVLIPESPRWLIAKKKLPQAKKVLDNYSRWNKKPKMTMEQIQAIAGTIRNQPSTLLYLLKSKILTIRALIVFFMWFSFSFAYFGITWASGNLTGNVYLNFAIYIGVGIPGFMIAPFLQKTIGRKGTACACFFLGGIACICTIFIYLYGDPNNNKDWFWGMMTLVLIGKSAALLNFMAGYVFTSEMFSTSTRSATQGTASMFARVGAVVAPYIGDLPKYVTTVLDQSLPQVVFGGISILAGLACLLLPETRDIPQLPDTIEQAENVSRKQSKEAIKQNEVDNEGFSKL